MALLEQSSQLNGYLATWKDEDRRGTKPVELLNKIADLLDEEATAYVQLEPDPFDDRHPVYSDPDCVIGHLLKTLYDNDEFLNKLLTSYMFNTENDFDLNCAAIRIIINMTPAMNAADIFQDVEMQVGKLMTWAQYGKEPLRSYSLGLLSIAMCIPECPAIFKDKNAILYPICVKRLKILSEIPNLNEDSLQDIDGYEQPGVARHSKSQKKKTVVDGKKSEGYQQTEGTGAASKKRRHSQIGKIKSEYGKQDLSLFPLKVGMQQKLILKYLHPMGEYQELLAVAFEEDVINLVFHYIDIQVQTDASLACGALLWLSSLLCHKKFIVEFIHKGGIQRILDIPQPSVVATMSSLCLYYMAHSEDAVERICLLSQTTLQQLIEYLLWLLECSHISGRCHSSLFFSMTFSFQSILKLFDSYDGFRKLINMISTLRILRIEESDLSTDDEVYFDREMAKNACLTIKKYLETQVALIAQEYKRIAVRQPGQNIPTPHLSYRPIVLTAEDVQENVEIIHKFGFEKKPFYNSNIKPSVLEKQFSKRLTNLNVAQLLLQLVAIAADWKNYNNRSDVMVTTLEALSAMSASRKIALSYCQHIIEIPHNESQSGIQILLRAVDGDFVNDIQVQKAALNVICNCVSTHATTNLEAEYRVAVLFSRERTKEMQAMQKIWSSVRSNNGIKILLSLLDIKTPITEADFIRASVCKALCGLADDHRIRQVFGKLPIFHNERLQLMMREPVLSDKTAEHLKFCKYAAALIEQVTGKPLRNDHGESLPMLSKITKADIIAKTKISYPQKELLLVIHNHLKAQGFLKAAETLKEEAQLPSEEKISKDLPSTPFSSLRDSPSCSSLQSKFSSSMSCTREPVTPFSSRKSSVLSLSSPFTSPQSEKRFNYKARKSVSSMQLSNLVKDRMLLKSKSVRPITPPTLDSIVTSYLREQHARCNKPVTTCPPFSLLRPHHCPEPRYRCHAASNIAKRLYTRQLGRHHGGIHGSKHNRRYIHSKFRPTGCIKETDEFVVFTCCTWLPDNSICLGTQAGDIKIYNYYGQEELQHDCHAAPLSSCNVAKNYKLLTTSATFGSPSGAVWSLKNDADAEMSLELKLELQTDHYIQFSNSEERVVGTDETTAHVYDLMSGSLVRTFYDQRNANHYFKNIACFGPGDDLLLNDGCLWDVRAKSMIHKFDKFNDWVSGVFHPSGLEIIINSEVWDIRTFHLLDTCAALDQCRMIFSNEGDIIYGVKHLWPEGSNMEHSGMLGPFETSFRTFDAKDYSPIATYDVKKTIFDLHLNTDDQVLAVLEASGNLSTLDLHDTTCRFFDVGRTKKIGEEDSDDETQEDKSDDQTSQEIEDLLSNIFGDSEDDLAIFDHLSSDNEDDDEFGDDDDGDDEDDDVEVDDDAEISEVEFD